MNKFRNRYRNSIRVSGFARTIIFGCIIGTLGVVYVYIKNKQVLLSTKCHKVEKEISLLRDQIEAVEEDIVSVTGRDSLVERLRRGESKLEKINPEKVVLINQSGGVVASTKQ